MGFYKVVLNGQAFGQDIKNILYYRNSNDLGIIQGGFGGVDEVADAVYRRVWPVMAQCLTNDYYLQSIQVYPYNDDFTLYFQVPYEKNVNEPGVINGPCFGPAACINLKFNLEPTIIGVNGLVPPRRGYVAIGPVYREFVGDSGLVIQDNAMYKPREKFGNLCTALAEDLNSDGFLSFGEIWPCRMKTTRLPGILPDFESFADIQGAIIKERVSFRRSRLSE